MAQDQDWHPWIKSEYDVVCEAADLISAKDYYIKTDFEIVASCINSVVGQQHANGSGWIDFQARVYGFFFAFGYKSAWSYDTGEFKFWKDGFIFWNWLARK